jgi:hypothetical protein
MTPGDYSSGSNYTQKSVQTHLGREAVQRMLRDAAYVLHLTRRVKDQILADRPERSETREKPDRSELVSGLGA